MEDSLLVIGPTIARRSEPCAVNEQVEETGYALEFATAHDLSCLPVYRCFEYEYYKHDFSSYCVREADVPFEIMAYNFQVKDYDDGSYITLSAFLAGMYTQYSRLNSLQEFLTDFYEVLPVEDYVNRPSGASEFPLKESVASRGYRIVNVMPYGRRLLVDIGWVFPQARNCETTKSYLNLAAIDFRPKPDRTLGEGKWAGRREHFIENQLANTLRESAVNRPATLLEESAISRMLQKFEWTPLAQMTTRQARQARIQFISKHHHLLTSHRDLATALKQADLYSPDTTVHQICRFLPSLISEATGEKSL